VLAVEDEGGFVGEVEADVSGCEVECEGGFEGGEGFHLEDEGALEGGMFGRMVEAVGLGDLLGEGGGGFGFGGAGEGEQGEEDKGETMKDE